MNTTINQLGEDDRTCKSSPLSELFLAGSSQLPKNNGQEGERGALEYTRGLSLSVIYG